MGREIWFTSKTKNGSDVEIVYRKRFFNDGYYFNYYIDKLCKKDEEMVRARFGRMVFGALGLLRPLTSDREYDTINNHLLDLLDIHKPYKRVEK